MTPDDNRQQQGLPVTTRSGRTLQKMLIVGLVLASALAGTLAARWKKPAQSLAVPPTAPADEQTRAKARYFQGWDKPDLVLVLTGSQHGYLLPCGCSHPQLGGLERRYNFVQSLRQRGWSVAAVDVGDIPQTHGPRGLGNEQGLLKYGYSMRALKEIGYSAVSFGECEAALPLESALAEYALQDPVPRVLAANLRDSKTTFPGQVGDWLEIKGLPIKTGVTAIIGHTVAAKIVNPNAAIKIGFEKTPVTLRSVVPEMQKAGLDLRILLYQGHAANALSKEKAEAVVCAEAWPQFQVVLAVGEEEEPSSRPIMVNNENTLITSLGYKGRYVGIVGIWRTGNAAKPFRFEYELVEMGEDLATPENRVKGHPIIAMIEEYTAELKKRDMLAKFSPTRHPLQVMNPVPGLRTGTPAIPTFIGSEKCKRCHQGAYDVWKKSDHSHAYATLVNARRPGDRQYDAECIVCHTVGFGYQTGFANANATPLLENVGCESCHGPGSHHARNPENLVWQARMNPWKVTGKETPAEQIKRLGQIDSFCQSCHNIDNDVNWTHNAVNKKWEKIKHFKEAAGQK